MASEASRQTRRFAASILKPLSAREAAAATRAIIAHIRETTQTTPDRLRAFPPEIRIDKPSEREGTPERLVRMRAYDRDQRLFHDLSVDGAGKVREHLTADTAGLPLLPDEVAEARRIAAQDEEVAKLLATPSVSVEVISAADHAPGRRAGLRLIRRRKEVEELGVVDVDLDRGEILRVELHRREGGR